MTTSIASFRILLVEDNPGDVALTRLALEQTSLQYELVHAGDGGRALELLEAAAAGFEGTLPDLILLDLNLPKRTGWEVLMRIKSNRKMRQIPVVVLTSSNNKEDTQQSFDLQAELYVTKRNSVEEYCAAFRAVEAFLNGDPRFRTGNRQTRAI